MRLQWEARSRSFFMTTQNRGVFKDDYALASGAGVGVLTYPFYGLQVGISGYFIYNLWTSKLHIPDSLSRQMNRYEIGLFDIENYTYKTYLDRLEELYIKYKISRSYLMFGKFNLNTPFFNPQDGRMLPTLEEGAWISIRESDLFGLNGGWIWGVSPRSTVRWFSLSESMGVYPSGVNPDGIKSGYKHEIQGCSGMAITHVYIHPVKGLRFNLWNGFLENVMNSALMEIKAEETMHGGGWYQQVLFIHQDALNYGGNSDPRKTYMTKGEHSNSISIRLGLRKMNYDFQVNYTHITGDGRYLMPREWGREVFYTFLPRERNEGLGNVHAAMFKIQYTAPKKNLNTSFAYGYYHLPDVKNYRLNKYGLPSYHQINFSSNYRFDKVFNGIDVGFLAAWKIRAGNTYGEPKYIYNKVDMLNLNLILDFRI